MIGGKVKTSYNFVKICHWYTYIVVGTDTSSFTGTQSIGTSGCGIAILGTDSNIGTPLFKCNNVL